MALLMCAAVNIETPNQTNENDISKGLRHPLEFEAFVRWVAMPEVLRTPKTQKELAEQLGIGADVLSDWKRREGFWGEVKSNFKTWGKERTPDVLHGLLDEAKTGNPAAVKLWLQYIEAFTDKSENDPHARTVYVIRDGDFDDLPATSAQDCKGLQ